MKRTVGRRFVLSPVIVGVLWLLASLVFRLLQTVGIYSSELLTIIKNFLNRGFGLLGLASLVLLLIGIIFLATTPKGKKSFTIKEIINYSRNSAKKNMKKFLLGIGICIVFQIISSLFGYSSAEGRIYLTNIIITLLIYIGMFRLGFGFKNLSLNIVNDAKAKFSDIFISFKKVARYAGAYIFVYLIVVVGIILLIIPGIIFSLKLSMVPYLIIDKNLGPIQAIKKSRRMTKGFVGDIFVLNLLCGLINILGILVVLVGLLRTVPLFMIANAYIYKKISALQKK